MLTPEKARKMVIRFMRDHELHAACIESENLGGCDPFNDLKKILLQVSREAREEVRRGIVQILDDYPDITVDDLARIKNEIYEKFPEPK